MKKQIWFFLFQTDFVFSFISLSQNKLQKVPRWTEVAKAKSNISNTEPPLKYSMFLVLQLRSFFPLPMLLPLVPLSSYLLFLILPNLFPWNITYFRKVSICKENIYRYFILYWSISHYIFYLILKHIALKQRHFKTSLTNVSNDPNYQI